MKISQSHKEHEEQISIFYLIKKKSSSETHENESWEFETLNENQLCTRAWHVITSLSPPRARVDWGPRARERSWKPAGCTHTPHKSFAGTQSGKIRAFYIVSLSVYFLRRKKRKNRENWGKERERERRFTPRATHDIEREKRSIREEKYERKRFEWFGFKNKKEWGFQNKAHTCKKCTKATASKKILVYQNKPQTDRQTDHR